MRLTVTGTTIHRLSEGKAVENWLSFDDLGVVQLFDLVFRPTGDIPTLAG
jgi:hypothetical protein